MKQKGHLNEQGLNLCHFLQEQLIWHQQPQTQSGVTRLMEVFESKDWTFPSCQLIIRYFPTSNWMSSRSICVFAVLDTKMQLYRVVVLIIFYVHPYLGA